MLLKINRFLFWDNRKQLVVKDASESIIFRDESKTISIKDREEYILNLIQFMNDFSHCIYYDEEHKLDPYNQYYVPDIVRERYTDKEIQNVILIYHAKTIAKRIANESKEDWKKSLIFWHKNEWDKFTWMIVQELYSIASERVAEWRKDWFDISTYFHKKKFLILNFYESKYLFDLLSIYFCLYRIIYHSIW